MALNRFFQMMFGGLDGGKCLSGAATAVATGLQASYIVVTNDTVFSQLTVMNSLTQTGIDLLATGSVPTGTVYPTEFGAGDGRYFNHIAIASGQIWYYTIKEG